MEYYGLEEDAFPTNSEEIKCIEILAMQMAREDRYFTSWDEMAPGARNRYRVKAAKMMLEAADYWEGVE